MFYNARSPWCTFLPTTHLTSTSHSSSPWTLTNCFPYHRIARHSAPKLRILLPLSQRFTQFADSEDGDRWPTINPSRRSFSVNFQWQLHPRSFELVFFLLFPKWQYNVVLGIIRISSVGFCLAVINTSYRGVVLRINVIVLCKWIFYSRQAVDKLNASSVCAPLHAACSLVVPCLLAIIACGLAG